MRIVFMGTPDFAACSLQRLLDEKADVVGVFCQPDKPKNRGHKLAPCEVKVVAEQAGIPVYQPVTYRDGTALEILKELAPELIVVVAYGRILPDEVLELPKYGCINVHGSLLPQYRGSAPIQRAVIDGCEITGVTTMYLATEMDAGDMIYSASTEIGDEETSGEVFDRLAIMGADLLMKTVSAIEAGTAPRTPQDHSKATYAPPLRKEEAAIDWKKSTKEILKTVFGMQPWPVAYTEIKGTVFKIFHAVSLDIHSDEQPGTVISATKKGIDVVCGDGVIRIDELQAAGGKRMSAGAYLMGHPMEV